MSQTEQSTAQNDGRVAACSTTLDDPARGFFSNEETVWLNRQQMSLLFDRDVKTIGKHIQAALREELEDSVVAKFATTASDGKTYQVEYYNL
ncbi:MAG: hypothetical protein Q4C05_09225, partial [Akkermansia sp.]|nr:hypothetical protein [Akkermansia sp.]